MATAYETVQSLDGMFGQPYEKCCLEVVKKFMNHKMKPRTPVRAHFLKMIDYLHEVELNGAEIDVGTQVGMILESLTPKFQQFKNNYVMNKMTFNLTQL